MAIIWCGMAVPCCVDACLVALPPATMRIAATRPRLPDLLSAYLYLLQSFPAPVIVRRPQVSWPGVVIEEEEEEHDGAPAATRHRQTHRRQPQRACKQRAKRLSVGGRVVK